VFVVPAEPPSFDAHREESFSLIHPAAPHYSTLLRVDPDDPCPDGFAFTFRNRAIRDPYEPLGVWLVDQWRQIGLNVKVETLELATLYNEIRGGNFDVAADFHCSDIVNYSRDSDRTLDEVFQRQSRATDREGSAGPSASSRSGCWTTKGITSSRSSGTGSCRTTRGSVAGRSRRATSSTTSSTRCG